ncbi:MAG: DnaJ domain-containing protein [Parvularculaceae bacterium]
MGLAVIALVAAAGFAAWILFRVARNAESRGARQGTLLKLVVWLALSAALFAAKLWPLAFMVLIAAGGVSAIEAWRAKAAPPDEPPSSQAPLPAKMTEAEARSILGIAADASADDIRAAHRKLIAQLHPDKGGTDYLAAKINDARDYLLRLAGER